MAVKSHIPGTTISVGYESETEDRAAIRCLVTRNSSHTGAIEEAKTAVGDLLFSGTYNVPLVNATATRFGDEKWVVTLNYARSLKTRRRDQTQRRIRIKSVMEYVDAFLIDSAGYVNGFKDSANPDNDDWFSLQLLPTGKQSAELVPRPYKVQRSMMRITLDYNTAFLTINDAELSKNGKLNSNQFAIAEIGGSFAAGTLKYEGFETGRTDIGQYPWHTTIALLYDPFGHYRQQVLWDQTLDSNNGKWKTISNYQVAESTTF
jgi:hypothetical protein